MNFKEKNDPPTVNRDVNATVRCLICDFDEDEGGGDTCRMRALDHLQSSI